MASIDLLLTKSYRDALKKRAEDIGKLLASGVCSSYSEYREMVGVVKGLNEALVLFEDELMETNKEDHD